VGSIFFFALATQLNSIIIVQYYMSEASFRIADSVKISRCFMFFPTVVFYQMCVIENALKIDGNTTLVQYIISLMI
jgi:hypothetical protein